MRRPSTRTVTVGLAVLAFAACSLLPVAYLLWLSLTGDRALATDWMLDDRQRRLLRNTTLLGTGAGLLASAIGVPLGVALARMALPAKHLFRLVLSVPILLPPYMVALAWTYLGSELGFPSERTHSLASAIMLLSLVYYPLSMMATEVAMRRLDARLEEAGLLVASPGRVLARITWPLVAPSVLAAALLIFVLAVSEFGVPGLLRVRVYTTEVFTAFAAFYDFGRAIVVAVPLLVLSVGMGIAAAAVAGERLVTSRRPSATRSPLLEGHPRVATAGAIAVAIVAVALPVLMLLREARGGPSLWATVIGSGPAIANSLIYSAIGALAVVTVAIGLGYARARAGRLVARLADIMFVVAFAVPSTIVGIGLIGLWNRPGPLGMVYGTSAMYTLGHLARFLSVAALIMAASIRYVPVSHEEAAFASGAGWLRTLWRIVIPQSVSGILAACVIVFVMAFGELGVSILVAPPGESTLPIRIYTLTANAPPSQIAALALLQVLVILTPVALLAVRLAYVTGRRHRPRTIAEGAG